MATRDYLRTYLLKIWKMDKAFTTVETILVGCPHKANNDSILSLLHQDEDFRNCTETIQLYEVRRTFNVVASEELHLYLSPSLK